MTNNCYPKEVPDPEQWIRLNTTAFVKCSVAFFLAGFASFSLIYCVQPLLPNFADHFSVSPAVSSLALSMTTGSLAIAIFLSAVFSQSLGRRGLMFASMFFGAILNIIAAHAPSWHTLIVIRAVEGVVLGGVPSVAMAYLAEEIYPPDLGKAMGLYISGTAFGAMMGRVGMGMLTAVSTWRHAMDALGILCFMASLAFLLLLPKSRHFTRLTTFDIPFHIRAWLGHLRSIRIVAMYGAGFLLISAFVTIFNYSTFRLSGSPYNYNQTQVSLIFLLYGFGIISSNVAGSLISHFGYYRLLIAGFIIMFTGVCFTLISSLLPMLLGVAFITTGFFIGHSTASSSVGVMAHDNKGHASSLYLLFYYMGSSLSGTSGGLFWQHWGWTGVVGFTASLTLLGVVLITSQALIYKKVARNS